jgi:hypothetical protein
MSMGLRTQAKIIGEKQSTSMWEICQVRGGGIELVILTIIYLL